MVDQLQSQTPQHPCMVFLLNLLSKSKINQSTHPPHTHIHALTHTHSHSQEDYGAAGGNSHCGTDEATADPRSPAPVGLSPERHCHFTPPPFSQAHSFPLCPPHMDLGPPPQRKLRLADMHFLNFIPFYLENYFSYHYLCLFPSNVKRRSIVLLLRLTYPSHHLF